MAWRQIPAPLPEALFIGQRIALLSEQLLENVMEQVTRRLNRPFVLALAGFAGSCALLVGACLVLCQAAGALAGFSAGHVDLRAGGCWIPGGMVIVATTAWLVHTIRNTLRWETCVIAAAWLSAANLTAAVILLGLRLAGLR